MKNFLLFFCLAKTMTMQASEKNFTNIQTIELMNNPAVKEAIQKEVARQISEQKTQIVTQQESCCIQGTQCIAATICCPPVTAITIVTYGLATSLFSCYFGCDIGIDSYRRENLGCRKSFHNCYSSSCYICNKLCLDVCNSDEE